MKFTFEVAKLVRELKLLTGAADRSSSISILGNVLIEASGDHVTLTTTDLELAVRSSCAADVEEGGAVTVPAARFLNYLRALPPGDVKAEGQKNDWLSLTSGRSKARIAGMSRESFPALPDMPETAMEISIALLNSMLAMTSMAISKEDSRFHLRGGMMQTTPAGLRLVATDGYRLSLVDHAVNTGTIFKQVVVPSVGIGELRKLAAEADSGALVRFAQDENNLFFEVGDRRMMVRKLAGSFPDYERVLPKEHPVSITVNREDLLGALNRVGQFADDQSRMVRLTVRADEIKLQASVSDVGESEEGIAAEAMGLKGPVEIAFAADYLVDFLKVVADERIILLLKDSSSAGELRPTGALAQNYRYVVMPMRA